MDALRQLLVTFGAEVDPKDVKNVQRTLGGMVKSFKSAAAGIGVAVGVGAITHFVKGQIELAGRLDHTAKKTGLTVDALRFLEYAAARADVPAELLTASIGKLQRAMVDAKDPNSQLGKTFRRVGIEVQDASGKLRTAQALLPEIADAIKATENPAERTALAMELFGKSGASMVPFLAEGSEGLKEAEKRFKELTGGSFAEFAAQGDAAGDAMVDLDFATQGFKAHLALQVIPTVTKMVTALATFVGKIMKSETALKLLTLGVAILGVALVGLAVKWVIGLGPGIALALVLAAGVVALALLIEDLWLSVTTGKGAFAELWAFIEQTFFDNFDNRLSVLWESVSSFFSDSVSLIGNLLFAIDKAATGDFSGAVKSLKTAVSKADTLLGPVGLAQRVVRDQVQNTGAGELLAGGGLRAEGQGLRAALPGANRAGASSNVYGGPVSINVTGVGDPSAVTDMVLKKVQEANAESLRQALPAVSSRTAVG